MHIRSFEAENGREDDNYVPGIFSLLWGKMLEVGGTPSFSNLSLNSRWSPRGGYWSSFLYMWNKDDDPRKRALSFHSNSWVCWSGGRMMLLTIYFFLFGENMWQRKVGRRWCCLQNFHQECAYKCLGQKEQFTSPFKKVRQFLLCTLVQDHRYDLADRYLARWS